MFYTYLIKTIIYTVYIQYVCLYIKTTIIIIYTTINNNVIYLFNKTIIYTVYIQYVCLYIKTTIIIIYTTINNNVLYLFNKNNYIYSIHTVCMCIYNNNDNNNIHYY